MRNRIALILVFILLFPCVVNAESTEKRDLVEFLELYIYRYTQYAIENDIDIDLSAIPYYFNNYINKKPQEYITFVSSAGEIDVDSGSYLIHRLTMRMWSSTASEEDNNLSLTSCVIAISALEFDSIDELGSNLNKKYLNSSRTVIDEADEIFNDIINKMDDAFYQTYETNERVLVCSYNYNYFIRYWSKEDHEYLDLIAEERQ